MLREIFDKHKCDKGSLRHYYDRIYEPLFEDLKDKEFNMLEIGILRGTSLEAWLEYFPKVNLYAIDVFFRVPADKVPILKDPRVNWCECNSITGPFINFKNLVGNIQFDVIIDDGLHFHDSQRETFKNFFPYLKDRGIYIIEDVWAFDRMTEEELKHRWLLRHKKEYSADKYNQLLKAIRNYYVNFHDLRKGYEPDSFLIEIRK